MIDKTGFMPIQYFKKEAYTGSDRGMRYLVRKQEGRLAAWVWPEPYGFSATPDSQKQCETFDFTPEGIESAVDWLNGRREARAEFWDSHALR